MKKQFDDKELIDRLLQLVAHINQGPVRNWSRVKGDELFYTPSSEVTAFYRHAYCLLGTGLRRLPVKVRRLILNELKAN